MKRLWPIAFLIGELIGTPAPALATDQLPIKRTGKVISAFVVALVTMVVTTAGFIEFEQQHADLTRSIPEGLILTGNITPALLVLYLLLPT